jgi:hypothetical protein
LLAIPRASAGDLPYSRIFWEKPLNIGGPETYARAPSKG